MKMTKKIILVVVATILIFVFISPFLDLYEKIVGRKMYGGMGVLSGRSYPEGFFMSYAFFVPLFIIIFSKKNRYKKLAYFLVPIFVIQVIAIESLIVSLGTAIISFFTALIIFKLKILLIKNEK